jgi:putative redox protein
MTSKVVYTGELGCLATHTRSDSKINTDAPVDNQGKGQAFSPTDLMSTSLATCMLTVMGIKARDNGWNMDGASAELIKEMADDPRRVNAIRIRIEFPSGDWSDKAKKLLEHTAIHCPVAKSIHPDIEQDISFIWP